MLLEGNLESVHICAASILWLALNVRTSNSPDISLDGNNWIGEVLIEDASLEQANRLQALLVQQVNVIRVFSFKVRVPDAGRSSHPARSDGRERHKV